MNGPNIPMKQRGLVLQGGGSLGAYEAGAYRALYEWLSKKDKDEGKKKSATFDIIAGTSIGAMNAAILVSYVIENNTFEGSAERLLEFWRYLSKQSFVDINPWFKGWWDGLHRMNKAFATGEAARRYYSSREFEIFGVPNVFMPLTPQQDSRFLDMYGNSWYRFSNEPLKQSLEKFAKFPIATSYEDDQPRLLLVAVDVADGLPVTFDSYANEDGSRKTEYGRYVSYDGKEIGFERVIRYDKGITSDHVMASGSLPVNFDYASMEVDNCDPNLINMDAKKQNQSSADKNQRINIESSSDIYYHKSKRYFWDGGLMSNTPLSQLVLHHRKYWYKIMGVRDKVPALGICIINVHPKIQEHIPTDHDGVLNRSNDITFSDRSHVEEEALLLMSDYMDLVEDLIKTAKKNGIKDDVINQLLNRQTKYHGQLKPRKYKEIFEGRYEIADVIRIERKNDEHTISDKTFDFSLGTIKKLLKDGYDETNDFAHSLVSMNSDKK